MEWLEIAPEKGPDTAKRKPAMLLALGRENALFILWYICRMQTANFASYRVENTVQRAGRHSDGPHVVSRG